MPSVHCYRHGVDVQLSSGHELAKRLDHLKRGKHASGSRSYASPDKWADSDSSVGSGDSGPGLAIEQGVKPGGGGVRPRSGTPEEDRGRLQSNGGRGFVQVRGGLRGM